MAVSDDSTAPPNGRTCALRDAIVQELGLDPDDAAFGFTLDRVLCAVVAYDANRQSRTTPAQIRDDLQRVGRGNTPRLAETRHYLANWLCRHERAASLEAALAQIDGGNPDATRAALSLSRTELPAGRPHDWALNQLLEQMSDLYNQAVRRDARRADHRRAGLSRSDDTPSGPFFRFVRECLAVAPPVDITDEALAHRIRRLRSSE